MEVWMVSYRQPITPIMGAFSPGCEHHDDVSWLPIICDQRIYVTVALRRPGSMSVQIDTHFLRPKLFVIAES
jgi:hypothetical protein